MACVEETEDHAFTVLESDRIKLTHDAFGRLDLQLDRKNYEAVRLVRCYPVSDPDHYVAILDDEQQTIGMIEDVTQLDQASRQVLDQELALRYLNTKVLAIRSVKRIYGLTTWDLETERGARLVYIKDRADIRSLGPKRVILIDSNDMRFEIPDHTKLDAKSAALLANET